MQPWNGVSSLFLWKNQRRNSAGKILEGLKEKYETHHKVVIEEKALEAAVLMSERYITDRHLPDKAIDVLDEACSKVSLKGYKVPENFRSLEDLIKDLEKQKEDSIVAGDFAEASLIQKEQDEARKKLSALKKRFDKKQAGLHPSVTENEVAEVVSVWTKVPVSKLTESDTERLKNLEKILTEESHRTGRSGQCCGKSSETWKSRSERSEAADRFVSVPGADGCRKNRAFQGTLGGDVWHGKCDDPR